MSKNTLIFKIKDLQMLRNQSFVVTFKKDMKMKVVSSLETPVILNVKTENENKPLNLNPNQVSQMYTEDSYGKSLKLLLAEGIDTSVECLSEKCENGNVKRRITEYLEVFCRIKQV